jgi:hypothetical protein
MMESITSTSKASLRHLIKAPMLRRFSLRLLASAISIASLPAIAQEDSSADDLGVMSISLKDVVKPTIGFQGALQGAGTPMLLVQRSAPHHGLVIAG